MRWQHYTKHTDTIDEFPPDESTLSFYNAKIGGIHTWIYGSLYILVHGKHVLNFVLHTYGKYFVVIFFIRCIWLDSTSVCKLRERNPWLCFSFPFRRFNMAFVKFNKHDRIFRIFYLAFFFLFFRFRNMVWLVYCFMSCDIDIEIFCISGTVVDRWICRNWGRFCFKFKLLFSTKRGLLKRLNSGEKVGGHRYKIEVSRKGNKMHAKNDKIKLEFAYLKEEKKSHA